MLGGAQMVTPLMGKEGQLLMVGNGVYRNTSLRSPGVLVGGQFSQAGNSGAG
jgi:hypothetical protein